MTTNLIRPNSVREYQQMFAHIYTEVDRRFSDHEFLLRLIEEISVVMEIVRKDRREDLAEQLVRTYAWLNGLANRLQIDLEEIFWSKYPNVCSYCLQPENCRCAVEHPNIPNREAILRRLRRDIVNIPKSLQDHQELHRRLYGRQNDRILPIQIAAHLAEEAGEISRDFRHKDQKRLEGEAADIASWIFALANRLRIDIAETTWEQYPYECEKCHEDICKCECSDPPAKEKNAV